MPEAICPECGAVRDEGALICPKCGFKVQDKRYDKSPNLAALLSIFPGLGQVYNGQWLKGVFFFLAALLLALWFVWLPFVLGVIVWVIGIVEAFITARNMNAGKTTPLPTNYTQMVAFTMVMIVVFFTVVGVTAGIAEILKFFSAPQ